MVCVEVSRVGFSVEDCISIREVIVTVMDRREKTPAVVYIVEDQES